LRAGCSNGLNHLKPPPLAFIRHKLRQSSGKATQEKQRSLECFDWQLLAKTLDGTVFRSISGFLWLVMSWKGWEREKD
jgi:hypothetical protein